MWRGKFALSPGEGGSRGCLILLDHGWEIEESFESLDGRMVCLVIKTEQLSVIAINWYAPNDHEITFFDEAFNKLIDLKDKYPEHLVVIAGDLNLVIDPCEDSINRPYSNQERISRQLVKENLRVLEIEDAYRALQPTGGYTWSRGNVFSRLDYVLVSNQLSRHITNISSDWTFDKSDHAAVKITFKIPRPTQKGPGIVRVNADILKIEHIKREFLTRLEEALKEIPNNWDPNKKLEFLKVITRSILGKDRRDRT